MTNVAGETAIQPYPGLRPFEPDEALKFYGRETHTAELLRRLGENRFIAVVGNSGSGKSSLVRAGLLPALYRGRLIGSTSQWRICIMRPGDAPMESLATALAGQKIPSGDIGRSSLGLVRAVRDCGLQPGESVLLVVDQFEEIFRFVGERKAPDGGAEARLFVSSLLEAVDASVPVYVVLTMRSDFLGNCSQFPRLPEALNSSQYLIPRMTREQVRDAVEKPLRLVGATMNPKLVGRLLNELGEDTGRLPVLQHALNRTWHEFLKREGAGAIEVDDYAAAGELSGALNKHAEALLGELREKDPALEAVTCRIFRCLTTTENGRLVRRPTRLDLIDAIAARTGEDDKDRIRSVIRTFGHPDHAMLNWSGPGTTKELADDSLIDISHESLIENWVRLTGWVNAEAVSMSLYRNAVHDTVRSRRAAASRWRTAKLDEALGYIANGPWSQPWAHRLPSVEDATFPNVKAFIEGESLAQQAEERERDAQLARLLAAEKRAKEGAEGREAAERTAKEQALARETAERVAKEAAAAQAIAERNARHAAEGRETAERAARESADRQANAERSSRHAAEAREIAVRGEREAAVARADAERQAREAVEAREKAQSQTRRWVVAFGALMLVLLALGLVFAIYVKSRTDADNARLKAESQTESALLDSQRSIAQLKAQIDASGDLLRQKDDEIEALRGRIARATSTEERGRLESELQKLLAQAAQLRAQRDSAAGTLSARSNNKTRVNPLDGLTYVYVSPGSFSMGCSPGDKECDDDEKPHPEQIRSGFWLGQTEVTQSAWKKVMGGGNPSSFKSDQLPVDSVSWNDADSYCRKAGGRLPAEKEWEYAARAGTTGPRYGQLDAIAWYASNSGGTTHPVGLKQPNSWGLYDMLGNVWEWTADDYDPKTKVLRGGSWIYNSGNLRASFRFRNEPAVRFNYLGGVRCVGE